MKPPRAAIAPLFPALSWTLALVVAPGPFRGAHSVFLISLGMLASAATAVVGMVVVGGRWAHRLGWAVVVLTSLVAVARPIDTYWAIGLAATLGAALSLTLVAPRMRKLPSATGPPHRAVLLPLVLLAVPAVIGAGVPGPPWAALIVGLSAPVAAFAYARVLFGGLVAARVGWPILAVGLSPLMEMPGPLVSVLLGVGVAVVAWHSSVRIAFHPPREVGSTFPIPPELAPREVLDSARLDDTGRPV